MFLQLIRAEEFRPQRLLIRYVGGHPVAIAGPSPECQTLQSRLDFGNNHKTSLCEPFCWYYDFARFYPAELNCPLL